MDNHRVVLEEYTAQRQNDTEVWTVKVSNSRIFSSFELQRDTDFYEDFIKKTMDFIKSYYKEYSDEELNENDVEETANDLLLAYTLIRWQFGKPDDWLAFLKKQYTSSSAHQSREDYRRYIESRQKRVDLEENEN